MKELPFPRTPKQAYNNAKEMALLLKLSLLALCNKAKVPHSTVYRWEDNKNSFKSPVYCKLERFFHNHVKKLAQ